LPDTLALRLDDIANCLQGPPNYVAVTALTALDAVIGRRLSTQPELIRSAASQELLAAPPAS
jgi:hypothetical protein